MARPRKDAVDSSERTHEAFEAHLWKAVERGSVTAMKLWADLHRSEFAPKEGAVGGMFTPIRDTPDA